MDLLKHVKVGEVVLIKVPRAATVPPYLQGDKRYSVTINGLGGCVSGELVDRSENLGLYVLLGTGSAHLDGAQWDVHYPIKLKLRLYYRAAVPLIKSLIKRG